MDINNIPPAVLSTQIEVAVATMAKEVFEDTAAQLVEMLEVSSLPGVGGNINIVA